jgi:hypothetical protein
LLLVRGDGKSPLSVDKLSQHDHATNPNQFLVWSFMAYYVAVCCRAFVLRSQ